MSNDNGRVDPARVELMCLMQNYNYKINNRRYDDGVVIGSTYKKVEQFVLTNDVCGGYAIVMNGETIKRFTMESCIYVMAVPIECQLFEKKRRCWSFAGLPVIEDDTLKNGEIIGVEKDFE